MWLRPLLWVHGQWQCCYGSFLSIINPRRACAARVTVVVSVCLRVCVSVCLLSHISPMERLFVLKTLSRTQRATKVKNFVGFSLKPLRCRDPAPPPLYGHAYSRPFLHAYFSCIYAHDTPPRVQHFSAFHIRINENLKAHTGIVEKVYRKQARILVYITMCACAASIPPPQDRNCVLHKQEFSV